MLANDFLLVQICLETFFLTLNRYFSLENLFVIKIVILYCCASPLPSTTSKTSRTGNEPVDTYYKYQH